MANRIRRTKEQVANELQLKLTKVKSDMRDEARKAENHKAIILGKTLQLRANNGNANAKRELDEILAGLMRDQDRKAFGLEPLPGNGSDNQPAANPSGSDPMAVAIARHKRAAKAWEAEGSERNRIEMGQAIAEYEKLTGKPLEGLPSSDRGGWGLGDLPGELLKAARAS
jgi:hypothetical protein